LRRNSNLNSNLASKQSWRLHEAPKRIQTASLDFVHCISFKVLV
jgi:hypothetical protein